QHDQRLLPAVAPADVEYAERITRGHAYRSGLIRTATVAGHAHLPVAVALRRQRNHSTHGIAGHSGLVLQLQPELGPHALALQPHAGLGLLSHLQTVVRPLHGHLEPAGMCARPDETDGDQSSQDICRTVEEPVTTNCSE